LLRLGRQVLRLFDPARHLIHVEQASDDELSCLKVDDFNDFTDGASVCNDFFEPFCDRVLYPVLATLFAYARRHMAHNNNTRS